MPENYKLSWEEKRKGIQNNYHLSDEWIYIIDEIFNKRIENYYLNPIESIITTRGGKGEGFSIVGLTCMLIETLDAFEDGEIYKHNISQGRTYEYSSSEKRFTSYLLRYFPCYFDDNLARSFYTDIRCGILHECRAKGGWKIKTRYGEKKDEQTDGIILDKSGIDIFLYRNNLFYGVKTNFLNYLNRLKSNSQDGENLRRNLGRKLDHLFDFSKDPSFDWWQ